MSKEDGRDDSKKEPLLGFECFLAEGGEGQVREVAVLDLPFVRKGRRQERALQEIRVGITARMRQRRFVLRDHEESGAVPAAGVYAAVLSCRRQATIVASRSCVLFHPLQVGM